MAIYMSDEERKLEEEMEREYISYLDMFNDYPDGYDRHLEERDRLEWLKMEEDEKNGR